MFVRLGKCFKRQHEITPQKLLKKKKKSRGFY